MKRLNAQEIIAEGEYTEQPQEASATYVEQPTDAENNEAQPAQTGFMSSYAGCLPIIMMFGVVYLLMIRPQQKQRKEHQKMIDSVVIGDKVVTQAGIIGKITNIKDNTIIIKIDENTNTKIEVTRASIVNKINKDENND